MPKNSLYPFGVPINTSHSAVSQQNGHLPNPPDMKMRSAPSGAMGMTAGKGDGKGGMADGVKRSSGSIDNNRAGNHAKAMGLTISAKNRPKGLSKPFGVKLHRPKRP